MTSSARTTVMRKPSSDVSSIKRWLVEFNKVLTCPRLTNYPYRHASCCWSYLHSQGLEAWPLGFGGVFILPTSGVIVRSSNLPTAITSIGPKPRASFPPNPPVQPSTMIRSVIRLVSRRVSHPRGCDRAFVVNQVPRLHLGVESHAMYVIDACA